MDIAAASMAMSQSTLSTVLGVRVLSMAKDQAVQQGQDLVRMMQQSLDPNLGRLLDVRA
ncbi:putative motility protein [Cohnella sp. CFH 77786]|uniref:YjfB family protein n=1 Tax=Cohnella sp. CFH 77786 TaxID=2662265 RepID=UPI001C608EC0|nr:YjfB family protein [Cohnella sp. CFH 77786]MBW5447669.1 putative motility protein [Cohnella sp. CFH 77786]